MYNRSMVTRWRGKLSRRTGLAVLAFFAFLLPCLLLSFLQYKSLRGLERKTRIEVEENLRQTLQEISLRTRAALEGVAVEAMRPVTASDTEREDLELIDQQLIKVREGRPEIDLAFIVVQCSCQKRQFAAFASDGGAHHVTGDDFKTNVDARTVIELFNNASLLSGPGQGPRDGLFEQSSCGLLQDDSGEARTFVLLPLLSNDAATEIGFTGVRLRNSFLIGQLLPRTVAGVLNSGGSNGAGPGPVITVVDEKGTGIYASRSGSRPREITMPFSPALRQWKLGIGYADTSAARMARAQFRQNVLLTAAGLSLLLIGLMLVLRTARRELKLAEAKGTFVSNVSHELKTPLALIRLFGETLEMGRVKDLEEARDYGRIISRESGRLTSLINNILDFSRIEAGRRQYQFVETDIGQLVNEVLQSYEHHLQSNGFEVTLDIASPLQQVPIDREAMGQAILNLLSNAMKYSTGVKQIDVRVQQRDQTLAIEIADHGIGIARAEQRKIFDKFYRVSTGLVHETRGTGLGLAIVKHVVEAHSGDILVDSVPGKGSRFTILLPIDNGIASIARERDSRPSQGPAREEYTIAENPHH